MFRYRLHLVGRQATLLMNFQLPNDDRTSTQWKECASLWLDLERHACTLYINMFIFARKDVYIYILHTYVHILIGWCPQVLHSVYKHICISEISLFRFFLAANSTLPDHRLTGCSATSLRSKGRFLHSAYLSPRKRRSTNNYCWQLVYIFFIAQLISSTHEIFFLHNFLDLTRS